MSRKPGKPKAPLAVEDIVHGEAKRKNIPTVEHQSVMQQHEQAPVQVAYPRANRQWLDELCALHDAGQMPEELRQRLNRELDPQLIWRGKDQQDWSDLVVNAPPLYIQEKVKPKALIDDLRRQTEARREAAAPLSDHRQAAAHVSAACTGTAVPNGDFCKGGWLGAYTEDL